ncbi:hypothetical protein KSD_09550 [Ktedonobacter sp. SOSP1-85]|uniref:DoxX family protein n=1 Tax=Ktedonobacter sp. SOSP1-85 TaxID=2778367 RepID=UPI00191557D7|nr:DoxX family protein [Ktedonobacter sp. SOSP1-85]GHO73184.1 hypothetical protein KSD_09550 [Ktedonobacter sp. SOSP1-85]
MSYKSALSLIRVLVGLLFVAHGTQLLFGWFGGAGLAGTIKLTEALGLRPAPFWGLLAALSQFGGGLLLLLGLLHPLGALAVMGAMLVAILKVHLTHGFWIASGGLEYALLLFLLAGILGLAGPGSYALDNRLSLRLPRPLSFWAGLAAMILVIGIGVASSSTA